jgi:hypothetical protein
MTVFGNPHLWCRRGVQNPVLIVSSVDQGAPAFGQRRRAPCSLEEAGPVVPGGVARVASRTTLLLGRLLRVGLR